MIEMPEHIIPSKIYKASPSEKEILEIFQYNKPINKYPPFFRPPSFDYSDEQ